MNRRTTRVQAAWNAFFFTGYRLESLGALRIAIGVGFLVFQVTQLFSFFELAFYLAHQPRLLEVLGGSVLLMEAAFPLVLLVKSDRMRALFLTAVAVFHVGNFVLPYVGFVLMPLVFVIFFDMDAVARRVVSRWGRRYKEEPPGSSPASVGEAPACSRTPLARSVSVSHCPWWSWGAEAPTRATTTWARALAVSLTLTARTATRATEWSSAPPRARAPTPSAAYRERRWSAPRRTRATPRPVRA